MEKKEDNNHQRWWMKLDNAAKIYPAITSKELTGVFRITAIMKSPVVLPHLVRATEETAKMFPGFSVELCKGFFWYYLEYNGRPPRIFADRGSHCQPFPLNVKGELMYRILTRGNTISVEFLHILTDGGGALVFLKTLLNLYARYCGYGSPPFPEVAEGPPPGGTEDQFTKFYAKGLPRPPVLARAWHLPYELQDTPRFRITSFSLPTAEISKVSKENGVTITEYLASVYLFALQELRHEYGHGSPHVRIQVPFDLRRKYETYTLRNFSLFAITGIDIRTGHYSFDEIKNEVKASMQIMTDEKRIRNVISRNVSKEKNFMIRVIPLFIKSPVLRFAYNKFGPSQFTSTITNMGRVIPEGPASELFESMSVTPPPPHRDIKVTCGLITLGEKMIITFGSVTKSKALEQKVVKYLTASGLTVQLVNIS